MSYTLPTADFVTTSLNGSITAASTSGTIGTGLTLPATNGILQVDYDSSNAVGVDNGPETIVYAAYNSTTGAITGLTRGAAGTTAVAHANTASVQCGMSSIYLSGTDLGKIAAADAWTAYTPVWTATGTAPVIGNGTITGKSFKIGKYCTFSMRMTAGTTTTFGTGAWIFSLPYATTASQDQFSAMAYMVDSSGPASYPGMTAITDTTHFSVNFYRVSGVGNPIIHINVNVNDPFIWASTDYIAITGTYEAA